jgi:hypothetical protein
LSDFTLGLKGIGLKNLKNYGMFEISTNNIEDLDYSISTENANDFDSDNYDKNASNSGELTVSYDLTNTTSDLNINVSGVIGSIPNVNQNSENPQDSFSYIGQIYNKNNEVLNNKSKLSLANIENSSENTIDFLNGHNSIIYGNNFIFNENNIDNQSDSTNPNQMLAFNSSSGDKFNYITESNEPNELFLDIPEYLSEIDEFYDISDSIYDIMPNFLEKNIN